jgi:hypothetical protein
VTSNLTPEALGILTDEARKGVGAETLLRVLKPILDSKLENLLSRLDQAPSDLGTLLDLRAQIKSIRSLQRELTQAAASGKEASEKLASRSL